MPLYVPSCLWDGRIKDPLLLIKTVVHDVAAAGLSLSLCVCLNYITIGDDILRVVSNVKFLTLIRKKEGNILFNDALNTFCSRLYCFGHMVKDHSDSERGNPLAPHGLLFPISS